MRNLILLLLLALPSLIFAADAPDTAFYGFSPDGRYCAFENYGIHDGSGFAYSELHIIDTAKNSYAAKISTLEDDSGEKQCDELRRTLLSTNAQTLKRLGISPSNKGTVLFTNPAFDPQGGSERPEYLNKEFAFSDKKFTLTLTQIDTGKEDPYGFGMNRMFKLVLKSGNREKILQQDTSLPKRREYAKSYRLSSAILYKNSLVVFVEYDKPGFEGYDRIKMAVSADITDLTAK